MKSRSTEVVLELLSQQQKHVGKNMADYEKYDSRVDSLVMETRTSWDADVGKLSEADRNWLAQAVHNEPEKASKVAYERSHTGFVRVITVTVADIARLYQEKVSGSA